MTIGPAPMMRMLLRSVRFGMALLHRLHEAVEQVADVVRPGTRFRVSLEAEGRRVEHTDALVRSVEQRAMRDRHVRRQGALVDREAVVLAGDEHATGLDVLHGV